MKKVFVFDANFFDVNELDLLTERELCDIYNDYMLIGKAYFFDNEEKYQHALKNNMLPENYCTYFFEHN